MTSRSCAAAIAVERVHLARPAGEVHGEDRVRARGDGGAHGGGVERQQVGQHVGQHGVAPTCRMALTVAGKVIGVVMTSSPGPMPSARNVR